MNPHYTNSSPRGHPRSVCGDNGLGVPFKNANVKLYVETEE